MPRRTQRNFLRQMLQVQSLQLPPRAGATITEFSTEEWAGGVVFVKREFCPGAHASSLRYREGFVVGVRGGVQQLYSHGNY